MMRSITVIFTLFLVGCTSYRKLEPIEEKMARFEPRHLAAARIPVVETLGEPAARRRAPASSSTRTLPEGRETHKYSSKKLYFLALYRQYGEFARYVGDRRLPDIGICPAFHTALLNHRESPQAIRGGRRLYSPGFDRNRAADVRHRAMYPELSLPLEAGGSVADRLVAKPSGDASALVEEAVFVHARTIYGELGRLCEYGHTGRYYTYQNLVSQKKDWSPGVLFKTLPFANMLILESLESSSRARGGRAVASVGQGGGSYRRALSARFGAVRLEGYLRRVSSLRDGELKEQKP